MQSNANHHRIAATIREALRPFLCHHRAARPHLAERILARARPRNDPQRSRSPLRVDQRDCAMIVARSSINT
jgi:hypothetical protein